MEDFECKAPMYVNFVESSALDENDGADKFFDCDETVAACDLVKSEPVDVSTDLVTVCTSIKSEPQESVARAVAYTDGQSDQVSGKPLDEAKEEPEKIDILNLAMANLWTASKRKNPQALNGNSICALPKAKGKILYKEEGRQNKKRSLMDENYQPRKFISMAEAVRQFQKNTPDRFHSQPKTAKLNSSLQHRKGVTVKSSTIPQTPHLTSHLRSRPVHYMTRQEEEEKEAEEMRAFRVKAKPLNPKILEPPKVGIRVEKRPPTVPVPFNLTEIVRKKSMAPPVFTFVAKPVPTAILESSQGVPKKKELPLTQPTTPMCLKKSKVYAISLGVKDGVKCVTEKEVHHFGIPTAGNVERKRMTEVRPFSFEERDRQLLKKKEEVIQKYLEQEKKNREFHAKPVPACIKSPNFLKHGSVLMTQTVPFQLEVDKRGVSKQEQLKQKLEEEVRQLQQAARFKARPATVIQKKPFEPKKSDRPLTDITTIELNTEKRAKEREEFDNKIRLEQAELEELRRMRDERLKREEMDEISKFRKEAVHKANPVRRYKPLVIATSEKILTDPQSPTFTHHSKAS